MSRKIIISWLWSGTQYFSAQEILFLKAFKDKHIDKCEAQNKFTEIHEAYSVLGDVKKRKIYDTKGHKGLCQEEDDFTSCNVKNFFCQKGFNGTDKSAFDVLRDIFEERYSFYKFLSKLIS